MEKINEIVRILEDEKKLYEKALEFSKKRNDALAKDQSQELQEILKEEEKISQEIKLKEKERISLMENPNKSLTDIISELDDDSTKEKLSGQRDELKGIIRQIKENNDMSQKLIKISNGLLDRLIEKVIGKKEIGYNRDKQKHNLSKNTLLNKKV